MNSSSNNKTWDEVCNDVTALVAEGGTESEEQAIFEAFVKGNSDFHANEKARKAETQAAELKEKEDIHAEALKTKDAALEAMEDIHKVALKKKDDEINDLKQKIKEWGKKDATVAAFFQTSS